MCMLCTFGSETEGDAVQSDMNKPKTADAKQDLRAEHENEGMASALASLL